MDIDKWITSIMNIQITHMMELGITPTTITHMKIVTPPPTTPPKKTQT